MKVLGEGCGRYADGDVPGVDRPWQRGDTYMWGEMAMLVTDPLMMYPGQAPGPPRPLIDYGEDT